MNGKNFLLLSAGPAKDPMNSFTWQTLGMSVFCLPWSKPFKPLLGI